MYLKGDPESGQELGFVQQILLGIGLARCDADCQAGLEAGP